MIMAFLIIGSTGTAIAQKKVLKVTSFQSDNLDKTSWDNTTATTYEENGRTVYCPVVKVRIVNDKLSFRGDDIVKTELQETGEYWIYMREGASSLEVVDNTVGTDPIDVKFSSHNIPSLRSKGTYILVLTVGTYLHDFYSKKNAFLLGIGGNIHPGIMSFILGYMYHHFSVELSVLIGGQSDEKEYTYSALEFDDYQYKKVMTNTWSYDQIAVRFGYELKLANHLSVSPQLGLVHTMVHDAGENALKSDELPDPSAWSVSVGGRLMWIPFGRYFRFYAAPQYNFCISKKGVFDVIYKADRKAKSYATGPSLEAGLLFYF